ncbi:hypothetical protein B5G03_00495 [Gemmiger sp. An50]|nr:hypothetical protein B5G03_00495 [Gemmiger sp. An50]
MFRIRFLQVTILKHGKNGFADCIPQGAVKGKPAEAALQKRTLPHQTFQQAADFRHAPKGEMLGQPGGAGVHPAAAFPLAVGIGSVFFTPEADVIQQNGFLHPIAGGGFGIKGITHV